MTNAKGKRKETSPVDEVININENIVEDKTETKTKTKTPAKKYGVVTCQYLNVREAPTTGASILLIIPKNTKVIILDDTNENWYKIRVEEIGYGFCMKEFINITK